MTIKLLASYGKYRCNDIITLDGTTETAMIAAGLATATLTGGTTWVDINADDVPAALSLDQVLALGAPDGKTTNWPIVTVTWANLPAAASFQGRICRVSDLNNALFESNGTRWKPVNGRALIGSTDASATMSGTTETVLFSKLLPAGLVKDNDRLIVNYTMGKSGTSESATMAMRLGTAGTIADTAIQGPFAGLTTTSVAAGVVVHFKRVTATSTRKLGQGSQLNPMVGAGTVAVTSPVTVSSLDANPMYFSFTNVMSSTVETFTLYDFTLELVSSAA